MSTKLETWEFARHVIVFTTRYRESAVQILEWYRMRWQIELVFKRLKSLAKLGHLPNMTTVAREHGCTESYWSRYSSKN
jgi:IS4 transposase